MNRLSILHIGKFYPPDRGGMETHLRDLAVRQAQVARVSVIVSNHTSHTERSSIDGVEVIRVARIGTVASMPVSPSLPLFIKRSPADLVHIHMPNPSAAAAFLLSGHCGELVLTHHADTLGRVVLRCFSDPFVRRLMSKAKRIITTSRRYLDSSSELMPYRDKCRIVPLGIELAKSLPVDPSIVASLRSEYGDRLVLSVGRLVPYKGFDILIRAMRRVSGRLLIIGSGPDRGSLQMLSSSEGVSERVTILGSVENLEPYFATASVFVLPSVARAEAFGLVQLEAMSAGIPVINTAIDTAVPEVSIHGVTGITVPPRDADALAEAINLLFERKDLRDRLGRAGRARVREEFSAEIMFSKTLSVYSEVLGDFKSIMSTRL